MTTKIDAATQRKLDAARAEYNARKAQRPQVEDVQAKPVARRRAKVQAAPPARKNFICRTFDVPADYTLSESIALLMVGKRREDSWSRIVVANVTSMCVSFGIAWLVPYLGFGLALAAVSLTASMFLGLAIFYVAILIGFWYAIKWGMRTFNWVRSGKADFDCAMLGVTASVKVAQVFEWFKPKSDEDVLAAAGA